MSTINKPMSAVNLVGCLAGDLLVDPAIVVETIKEDEDIRRVVRSYSTGDFTYEQVLDTIAEYF